VIKTSSTVREIVANENHFVARLRVSVLSCGQSPNFQGQVLDVRVLRRNALIGGSVSSRVGEADATIEEIRDGLTQTTTAMTVRYIRRRGAKGCALADKRSARRAAENDGGTAYEPRVRITSESQLGK
jgi:hypothetical protein